ncbi:uncharacterized protein J4E88_003565 [Alternaria novae-zelandiae]|uniref:uncharacterized protein n=1 Tax=Alternaria novae-zelandiae TaxID=430562 RepID=UPI0020C4A9F6|nr:uncharacterized protein J4E88_003565 [Alternaria novae-zelandiae]KAI4685730.1 hypothetical protein J4E88_003565 [Alternaria novae-zelandiae]
MADRRWKCVSASRYAVQVSLCSFVVYLSTLIAQTSTPTVMIWGSAPYIGLVVAFGTRFGPSDMIASQTYCVITTVILLYLDKAATAIGKTAEPNFEDTGLQHRAVHFALAFFVLSELEYHRQYYATKSFKKSDKSSWRSWVADADRTFNVSRHQSVYWHLGSVNEADNNESEESFASTVYYILRVLLLDSLPFHLVGGCFNYAINSTVNPTPPANGRLAMQMIGNFNVFFNTKTIWGVYLNLWVLSRVVRQANFITVWGIFRVSSGALDWSNRKRVNVSHEHYEKSQGDQ